MPTFVLRYDFPKELLSARGVRDGLMRALEEYCQRLKGALDGTVSNWQGDDHYARPVFTIQVSSSGNGVRAKVITDSPLWGYLNDGTDERWAIMNDGYGPKTSAGSVTSNAGARSTNRRSQYTAIRGRQAMQERNLKARPGVRAREWSKTIAEAHRDELGALIDDAIRSAKRGKR